MKKSRNELIEYLHLMRMLPKELSRDELARFQQRITAAKPPTGFQVMTVTGGVCREGYWRGVVIVVHRRGIVGHYLVPGAVAATKADAQAIADKYIEFLVEMAPPDKIDYPTRYFPDEIESDDEPCPPS